jgi:phage tail-like protein
MACPEPLFGTSHFRVHIGRGEIGFSEVSRLTSETDVPDVVVLRRALTQATELYEWRQRVAGGKDDRRDVTIEMLDAAGGAVVNSWRLVGARPNRWSGPSFDAGGAAVAMEELELTYDDLVWLAAPDTIPTKERR